VIAWEGLAQQYAAERPTYGRLARLVANRIRIAVGKAGIPCEVSGRAKEVDSFVKKALRPDPKNLGKLRYSQPFLEIKDKAGVRAIVTFDDDLDATTAAIADSIEHGPPDDKRRELEFDRLGYFAIHLDVWLSDADAVGELSEFRGRTCEVQIQTRAGNLWSEGSHDLLYKAVQNVPLELQRRVYRLLALVELFDSEMSGTKRLIRELPGYEDAALLVALERLFYRLTAARSDQQFSIANIVGLRPAYDAADNRAIVDHITPFVQTHWRKLENIYGQQSQLQIRSPLIFQPESLLIFERLETAPLRLQSVWKQTYALEYLQPLGLLWGTHVELS